MDFYYNLRKNKILSFNILLFLNSIKFYESEVFLNKILFFDNSVVLLKILCFFDKYNRLDNFEKKIKNQNEILC